MDFLNKLNYKLAQKQAEYTTTLYKPLPGFTTLNMDPYVAYMDNAFSESECQEIIECCDNDLTQAAVFNDSTGASGVSNNRTCKEGVITPYNYSNYHNLRYKLAEIAHRDQNTQETISLVKYEPGDHFLPHHDSFDFLESSWRLQRVMTTIVYLNDIETGGETYFPDLDVSIQPRRGRMVVWHNCGSDARNQCSLSKHQGKAPDNETKYIISVFWCINDYLNSNNTNFIDDCQMVKQVIKFKSVD